MHGRQASGRNLCTVREASALNRSGHLLGSGGGITQLILRLVRNGCVLISSSRLGSRCRCARRRSCRSGGGSHHRSRSRCGSRRAHRCGSLLIGAVLNLCIHGGNNLISGGSRSSRGSRGDSRCGRRHRRGGGSHHRSGCRSARRCGSGGGCFLNGASRNLHGGCLAAASGVIVPQGTGEQIDVHGDTLLQVVLPGNGNGEVALLVSLNFQVVLAVNLDGALVQLDSDGGAGSAVLGQETFAGNLQGFALVPYLRNVGGCLVGIDVGDGLFTVLSESCGNCGDRQTATDQGGGTEASDSVSNVHPIILSPHSGYIRLSRGYLQ